MLEPGEVVAGAIHGGDTLRWQIEQSRSGTGKRARVHLFIKPKEAGIATNVVVPTNRRVYHLQLEATDDLYLPAVAWTYPSRTAARRIPASTAGARRVRRAPRNRGYQIRCAAGRHRPTFRTCWEAAFASWLPSVSDDGRKTYVRFPQAMARREAPVLYALDAGGAEPELVNYRVVGNAFVVDRLLEAAELRLGSRYRMRITRTDRPRRWSGLYRVRCGHPIPRRYQAERAFASKLPAARDDGRHTLIRLPPGIDAGRVRVTAYVGLEAVLVRYEHHGALLVLPDVFDRLTVRLPDGRVTHLSRPSGSRGGDS